MKEKSASQPRVSPRQKIALVLLGLILSLVLLEGGLRLGGFVLLSLQEYGNLRSIKQKGAYRILCLGESTTQGQYPSLLEKALNQRDIGVRFSVIDKGLSGIITPVILSRVESFLDEYHPDMVVAMMGINDWSKHMPLELPPTSKGTLFIRSLRIYKLARLLWLHLLTRAKEVKFGKTAEVGQRSEKIQTPLPRAASKETLNEPISANDPFKKVIEIHTKNDHAYAELGWLYKARQKSSRAEESFKKAIEINPKNDHAYTGLGRLYLDQGKLPQSEDSFKKAIELNPKNDHTYVEFGRLYQAQGKLSKAEGSFKKAIEINPKNDNAYVEFGRLNLVQGKFSQAEDSFKKIIGLDPENDNAYVELGWLYQTQGKFARAEDFFNKAIGINPKNNNAYAGLGRLYQTQGEFSKAEGSFRKAIEINPKNDHAYVEFGRLYLDQGKFSQAEDSFKKIIELDPENDNAYVELGWLYQTQGKFFQAEGFFKKAIEINPKNDNAYAELGRVYRVQNKFSEAEDILKKAIEINPKNDRILGALSSLYEEMRKPALEEAYAKKADRLREDYNPMTINNYRKLKEILDQKRIRLVCVQYPMRNVGPLKKLFEKDEGVIFVDNKKAFKEALKKESYKAYFKDMFGGDFGHCTPKGNTLLAQNIAEVILKEVFNN